MGNGLGLISGKNSKDGTDHDDWAGLLKVVALVAAGALFLSAALGHSGMTMSFASLLIAGALWLTGGLLGFLFGIPKVADHSATTPVAGPPGGARPFYMVNTNLEQVSDWLTKIIVGVGLVEAQRLWRAFVALAETLKPCVGGEVCIAIAAIRSA